jgi:pimeloyl-ACP methyl ester carboxylesterase
VANDIRPFTIQIPDDRVEDLKRRLAHARWPDELEADPWRYGPPVEYMKSFAAYWLEQYDWRAQEARLNSLPQFKTSVGGQYIHFIHLEGKGPEPLPLILTHGWPGSFLELIEVARLLADPAAVGGDPRDAFSVVVPSMPGYGFSERPTRRGMSIFAIADLWAELMPKLGYERFGVQGGDWGSWVSAATALQHPHRVIGVHLNYLSTRFRPPKGPGDPPLSEEEEEYLRRVAAWLEREGGYIAIKATKPLTLAYALMDSPLGLAAWYVEKFKSWTDSQTSPEEAISRDDMITDIMIHWLTDTAHSAMRLYAESREHPLHLNPGQRILPPCGIVHLPAEIPMPPRNWAERAFNIIHWTKLDRGGHFAAWEVPDLLAQDIRDFFRHLRGHDPSGRA